MGRDTFHKPHKMLLGLCLGPRAAGRCLCHPSAWRVEEFCQSYSLHQSQREPAGGRGRGNVKGAQGSKEKPAGPSLLPSVLQEESKPISRHDTPAAPGGAGWLCPGLRWGWCSQTATNSSQPVASFCDDSQACALPSAPRLGQTPVIILLILKLLLFNLFFLLWCWKVVGCRHSVATAFWGLMRSEKH